MLRLAVLRLHAEGIGPGGPESTSPSSSSSRPAEAPPRRVAAAAPPLTPRRASARSKGELTLLLGILATLLSLWLVAVVPAESHRRRTLSPALFPATTRGPLMSTRSPALRSL